MTITIRELLKHLHLVEDMDAGVYVKVDNDGDAFSIKRVQIDGNGELIFVIEE